MYLEHEIGQTWWNFLQFTIATPTFSHNRSIFVSCGTSNTNIRILPIKVVIDSFEYSRELLLQHYKFNSIIYNYVLRGGRD